MVSLKTSFERLEEGICSLFGEGTELSIKKKDFGAWRRFRGNFCDWLGLQSSSLYLPTFVISVLQNRYELLTQFVANEPYLSELPRAAAGLG